MLKRPESVWHLLSLERYLFCSIYWLDEGSKNEDKSSNASPQAGLMEAIFNNWWADKTLTTKPILVKIKLKRLKGRVTLNMPSPPADRFW